MKRVLVVDDDRTVREVLSVLLRDGGYAVTVAADGIQGLESIRLEPPDLVILDLEMPRLDGWGVLEALRGIGALPPTIVLSAEADPDRAARQGAFLCVPKPFRPEELLDACRRALSEPPIGRDPRRPPPRS
jgi:CheY-like chemotaxis protein